MSKKVRGKALILLMVSVLTMMCLNVYGNTTKVTYQDGYLMFGTWNGNGNATVTIGNDYLTKGSDVAKYNEFEYLECNKNTVSNSQFSVAEQKGNVVISLNESYLKSLQDGMYSFKAVFAKAIIPIRLYVVTHKIDFKDASFSFSKWNGSGNAEALLESNTFSHTFYADLFNQLTYKGIKVDESNYTVSTISDVMKITLKEEYVKTLPEGESYFTAEFSDSSVMIKLTKPISVKINKTRNVKATLKNKKLKITWKKVKNADGYVIKVGENKKLTKSKKTVNVKKNKGVIRKVNANKTYYLKVRAYKIIDGKKNFGEWSKLIRCNKMED